MATTPDRTTIKATILELTDKLRANLVADPPTSTKPFRRIEVGEAGVDACPRPFLSLRMSQFRPIATTDNDKVFEVAMQLTVVSDVSAADPHSEILDEVGVVEDYLDSIIDIGVIEGAEGFDNRIWTFDYPRATAGARVATATASQTFVVRVEREYNREPAS